MNLRLAAAGLAVLLVSLASESSAIPIRVDFIGEVTWSPYSPESAPGGLYLVGSVVTGLAIFDPAEVAVSPPDRIIGFVRIQAGSQILETQIYAQPTIDLIDPPPGSPQWRLTSDDSHGCLCGFRYIDILIYGSSGTELHISQSRVIPPYLYGPPALLSTVTLTQWSNSLAAPEPGLVPLIGFGSLLLAARRALTRRR